MYNIVHVPPPPDPKTALRVDSSPFKIFIFFSQKIRLFNRWLHMQLNYAL